MDKFAFIIHPLHLEDFTRKYSWTQKVPDKIIESACRLMPAFEASHITGIRSRTGKEIEGFFVGCTLTSEQIMSLPTKKVIKKIIKAGQKAEELGARIVGLGAFTSVVGDKGISIARELNIPVTTGNSYTVATAIEGTKLAAKKMEYNFKELTVAIIGATGSIGKTASQILSFDTDKLILAARNKDKLKRLADEVSRINPQLDISYTVDIPKAIRNADVIISASGAVEPLIEPEFLQPGTIVCDVARPRDVANKIGKMRDDILVIEGGVVKVPGQVEFNLNFGYPPGTAYACMAETMMLTLEGRFEDYSLGPDIEIEKVKETVVMAKKHGFKLAALRSFERALSEETIEKVKENAREKLLVTC